MTRASRRRVSLVCSAVVLLAAAVGARLFQLQIVLSDRFRTRADDQHQVEVTVPSMRGSILDRRGNELALSVESSSFFVNPPRVEDPEAAVRQLGPVLGMSRRELLSKLHSTSPFVFLKRCLSPQTVAAIEGLDLPVAANGENAPFGFIREPKRVYPRGALGVHVVGYAGVDEQGLAGAEERFDALLRGDETRYVAFRDARNVVLIERQRPPEREPQDLVLTLDSVLQQIVESELDQAMQETRARSASVVLLDPATGEVLALANRPAIDANRYGEGTGAERVNRAVSHAYEPGSTFKVVPMAAALERGRVSPDDEFFCERGRWNLGRRVIHDTSSHGTLTAARVLAESSNIGMVKITGQLTAEELAATIRAFGFGVRTGIELPGETPGLLADTQRWTSFSQPSLAFGQEIGVSVIQMASALGAIANNGVLVPPRIALGVRSPAGSFTRFERPPARRIVSSSTARTLARMMADVVASGTGRRGRVEGYSVGGKTGTAQKAMGGELSSDHYMASFGGFAPVHEPRVVALVVLDSPHGQRHQGGQVAAPVFSRIMTRALHHLRVPQDLDAARRAPDLAGAPRNRARGGTS